MEVDYDLHVLRMCNETWVIVLWLNSRMNMKLTQSPYTSIKWCKKNSECSMYHVVQLHMYVKTILATLIIQEMKQDFWPKCAWGANVHVSNHVLVIVWCVLHTIECVDSLGINFSKVVFESRKRDICSRLDVCSKYKEVNGPSWYPCENGFACSDIHAS